MKRLYNEFVNHPYYLTRNMMFLEDFASYAIRCFNKGYEKGKMDMAEYRESQKAISEMVKHDSDRNIERVKTLLQSLL